MSGCELDKSSTDSPFSLDPLNIFCNMAEKYAIGGSMAEEHIFYSDEVKFSAYLMSTPKWLDC